MLIGGLMIVLLVTLSVALRFGLFARASLDQRLEAYARERGYRPTAPCEIEAVKGDVAVRVSFAMLPSHGGPTTAWKAAARAIASPPETKAQERSWVRARPKHENTPGELRVGDATFDSCFLIEGSSRELAKEILDAPVRARLLDFGPYGESHYEDGAFTFSWEDSGLDPKALDQAIAIAEAACRLRRRSGLYRD